MDQQSADQTSGDRKIAGFDSKLDIRKAAVEASIVADCPVRDLIDGISGKWTTFLIMALAERPHRFGELRRLLPDISQRMLTQTLHDLRRDGYVLRQVLPTNPPSVEYSLSPLGLSMFGEFRPLLRWIEINHRHVREARTAFDAGA